MPDPDDLDTNKPIILTTPIPSEKPVTILSTQDQGKLLQKLGTLPGFNPAPSESIDTNTESLPIHEQNWQDLILESRMSDKVNKPDPAAEGREHTVIKVGPDGKITNYGTYEVNPKNPTGLDLVKRVDLDPNSRPHYNNVTGEYVPTTSRCWKRYTRWCKTSYN
ncbi:MAG: hypothetical protein PV347_01255 [Rickettsiaceae bacterium]|nr:hypothetical protein [Rickettsiaceae bacterium]MDD9337001.1 hypothetical protein [Rickettsiaceae bacterium]